MVPTSRYPLATRPQDNQQPTPSLSHLKSSHLSAGNKRPRSPETTVDDTVQKRSRPVASGSATSKPRDRKREHKQQEKEAKEAVFREKYTRAFPQWTFYFDSDNIGLDVDLTSLEVKIEQLGGTIEDFFSKEVTHLISDKPDLEDSRDVSGVDKENVGTSRQLILKSPVKLNSRAVEDAKARNGFDLVSKAKSFGIKIWNTDKLTSVTSRCLSTAATTASRPTTSAPVQRDLTRLLQSERIHGTSERDPTQRRHDFRYFTKGSYFVLVEDMHQELATIAAQEYANVKGGDVKASWPVLHCHPHARGPFIAFDEKEKRRWERAQHAEQSKGDDRDDEKRKKIRLEAIRRRVEAHDSKKAGDLRRSVSMNNLRRRAVGHPDDDLALDPNVDTGYAQESATASGYLASGNGGYIAASGNSVSITSTTGTTSTASYAGKNQQLPAALRSRVEVITSRKSGMTKPTEERIAVMGPPTGIPERRGLLKKSRSTNSLRLPKRDEGSKPGYCESCRMKFDDFKRHIESKKHRKFAVNDANFSQLDCVLARVKRRTLEEHEEERIQRTAQAFQDGDRFMA